MTFERPRLNHFLRAPRTWWSIFVRAGGWWALLFGALCLLATGISIWNDSKRARFEREGIETSAEVVRRGLYDEDTLVRFQSIDGDEYTVGVTLPGLQKLTTTRGAKINLRYLRSDPEIVDYPIGSVGTTALPWSFRSIALFFGVAGLVVLAIRGFQTNARVLARLYGDHQRALVVRFVEHETTNKYRSGSGYGYMVWELKSGERGHSLTHPIYDLQSIGIGSTINVYVRDGVSTWEGDVGPRPTHKSDLPRVKS